MTGATMKTTIETTTRRRRGGGRGVRAVAARLAACSIPLLLSGGPLAAQEGDADRIAEATRALEFRELGPTIMSGRIADLAVVESDPSTFYVGTASGGVWKTENAGITFEMVFDEEPSIGDVTVAPSNPNVVWVGTGEPQNRQSSPWGSGVWRSTDAGRTWTHLGLEETRHVSRIQVHPRDPDVAYVGAVGHLWGPNPERGLYRTTDGGETWERVLFVDDDTGVIDLAMDMNDPRTLFAATYQRRRRAWGFNGGGPGSGIWRTVDGGDTWTRLDDGTAAGLPTGDKGRIGLDIYRGDGDFVCALVEADARDPEAGFFDESDDPQNGVYCSTDRGATWEHRSTTNNRPMYYSQIRIDPTDPERIYLGGSDLFMSQDGGRTFTDEAAAEVHLDHHALWIDPADPDHLILGSDGGVSVSRDRSENWYQYLNLPISQFYEIGLDNRDPYHVCGGLQDNGSWCAPSDTWSSLGVRTDDWYNVGSGDGFFTVMHPDDPTTMLAESQGGFLTRVDLTTGERAFIRPQLWPAEGQDELEDDELPRWNWNTPVVRSSHDPNTIYVGSNLLFRSRDQGQSWQQISEDLTYAVDRDTLELMGVPGSEPQMSIHDGQSSYGNLTAIAESPRDANVLWTGSDDGRLHVSRDGGATWTDVTGNVRGVPRFTYVTRIVASHAAPGAAFVAFDGHRSDDYAPYVYRTSDFGASWTAIHAGLPQTSVNALAQHPRNADLLFVGNEVGVYVSIDGGGAWTRLENGLPNVPVDDIEIHPRENDLVLGTHGRGIWIMDDIGPLEHLSDAVMASDAHIFPVRAATSYNSYNPQGWTPGIWEAETPPMGARIRYWLGDAADSVVIRIADASGEVVRELDAGGAEGLNEERWDLRLAERDADGEWMDPGPRVLPGTYRATLVVDGVEAGTVDAPVRIDPRARIARADLMARQEAMLDSYRLMASAQAAGAVLDTLDTLLENAEDVLEAAAEPDSALIERVGALRERVEEVEDDGDAVSDGAFAWFRMQGVTAPPTADNLEAIDRAWERIPGLIDQVNALVTGDVPAVLAEVYRPASMPDVPEPVDPPRRGG